MYTNEALSINQWNGINFPNSTRTGEDVLKQYGFDLVCMVAKKSQVSLLNEGFAFNRIIIGGTLDP